MASSLEKANQRWSILSSEQKVLLTIHKSEKGMHLAKLCRRFEGEISKVTIIKILGKLQDSGYIVDDWKRVETSSRGFRRQTWVRNYEISSRALAYVNALQDITYQP